MITDFDLPPSLWTGTIATVNYIRNWCITKVIPPGTPYERWHNKKLDVSNFHGFKKKVLILEKIANKGKFDAKAIPSFFVGYSEKSKGFQI